MTKYVIVMDSYDILSKHPKFKTDIFPIQETKATIAEFGRRAYAVPIEIYIELCEENKEDYNPYDNHFDY